MNSRNGLPSPSSVAIIGAACRFPGGSNTPELFFSNLLSGQNFVSEIPLDRWSIDKFFNERDVAGKAYVRHGHFLQDYDYRGFDAEFFNFSPREVESFDPQQRLLLELSWEALECAGLDPETLAGSDTGVFIGGFTVDHLLNQFGVGARDNIGMHSAAGSTLTMLSNRISYAFDFRGPSFSLDTACSSSLVALAQAVNAVKAGQCEMALVGGANIILRPEYTIAMSKGRFLAKDGRSKSFDARADGYGRGEGGGIVVVKDYAAALRDGDCIMAVIDGVGVNQDGRTSGITVPNPDAQRHLMRQVLDEIGCASSDIDYIEAHGTGTAVGDPLETRAIADVYGQQGHCVVGSVKASIGHLEAAAGIAGVIKSVMMLRHNIVPPVAGLEEINPAIPAEVQLPRTPLPLSANGAASKIAINSFGYGGTNAHVVLSKADHRQISSAGEIRTTSARLLPISARSSDALNIRAQQFIDLLKAADENTYNDILYTAAQRRTHMTHRLGVWGQSRKELIAHLQSFVDGHQDAINGEQPLWLSGKRTSAQPRVAFVYTGMGPQWHAMGRELFAENTVFRETLQAADTLFQRIAGFSILAEMFRDEADSRIKQTEFAQPANLLVQMGLTAALKAEGIIPAAVVGHSVGEVASAWASGMLTMEEALLVSRERSRAQATTAGMGSMLALGVSGDEAKELIAAYGDKVSIAALNSPRSVTVAGDTDAIDKILAAATARDIFARKLDVEVPYHSPVMEQLKPALRVKLASLQPQAPHVPLYSTVSGERAGHIESARTFDAEYWCDNVRESVFFADAIRTMLRDGITVFVEVGPHPVLRRAIEEVVSEQNAEARIASTLWMNKSETPALQRAVAEIFVHGGAVEWAVREPAGLLVETPAYPWQRKTLWREALWQERDRLETQQAPLNAPAPGADLNLRRLNYLFDHVVDGAPIMPAAGFLEALCEEARRRWPQASNEKGWCMRDVKIREALVLDSERTLKLDMRFNELTRATEVIVHEDGSNHAAVVHAEAILYPCSHRQSLLIELDDDSGEDSESLEADALYSTFHEAGLQYGPAFRVIQSLKRNFKRGEALAVLNRPLEAGESCAEYVLHPSLLDGCFQTALSLLDLNKDGAFLPVSLRALEVYAPTTETIICRTRIVARDTARVICDFEIADENGTLLARIKGLLCIAMRGEATQDIYPAGDYQREWLELPAIAQLPRDDIALGSLAIIAERADKLADALFEACQQADVEVSRYEWAGLRDSAQDIRADRVVCLAYAGRTTEANPIGEDQMIDLLHLAQVLSRQNRQLVLRVVTRNANAVVNGDVVVPAQSAVAGFTRVVRNEMTMLDTAVIDLDIADNNFDNAALYLHQGQHQQVQYHQINALLAELFNPEPIDEIALRDTRRFGVELVQSGALQRTQIVETSCSDNTDGIDNPLIELVESGERCVAHLRREMPLAENAYEIRVESLGVHKQRETMGFSGTIVRAGKQAREFSIGDRVFGLAPKQLKSIISVTTDAAVIKSIPGTAGERMSGVAAVIDGRAAMIVNSCAITAGAKALVGSGVLGDALSHRLAAAGMNVTRIDGDFANWHSTAHDGIFDVIAAPLARWSKEAGFSALKADGQLIELDDDSAPFALPLQCGRFIRVACALNHLQQDARYAAALHQLCRESELATEKFSAPTSSAPSVGFADLVNATNTHTMNVDLVGESVTINAYADWIEVRVAGDTRPFEVVTSDLPALQRDAIYLITGGFGGLGSELARWLAKAGAGHIALVGRRGAATPEAAALLDELRLLGATPSAHALDISDTAAVHTLIQTLNMRLPLRGVFHAAGVLEDHLLSDMNAEHISRVMRTKAGGALALHEALNWCRIVPDYFVLFSSIANLVGNSRQANYCAANGFLDGLAHRRRALNLPALSINFGAIAGIGMLDGDSRVGQHLTQIGMTPLDVKIALTGIGRAMVQEHTQIAVCEELAWEKWAAYEAVGGESPAFRKLVQASRAKLAGDASLVEQLHTALIGMDANDARAVVSDLISEVIASALKTTPDRLTHDDAFDTFGVDSLMSTEIQIQLDRVMGVSYSVVELLGHATISKLADKAISEISLGTAAARAA
jgi:acyl transferase domain-containing protein/NADP-dependent 3-hydroxy acid dehydrogenase YdfG/acyl carrier protein